MPTSHPQLNSTICSHCSLRNHNLKLGFLYASLFGGSLSKALRYKPNPCKREIGSQGGLSHSGHSLPFTTVAETRGSADTDNKNIQKWGNKNLLDNFTLKEFVSTFLPTEGKCNVTGASGTQQGGPSSTPLWQARGDRRTGLTKPWLQQSPQENWVYLLVHLHQLRTWLLVYRLILGWASSERDAYRCILQVYITLTVP